MASKAWQVELQCPQCGAPVTLEETDRILSCSFCRVRLVLVPRDLFRYHLVPAAAEEPLPRYTYVPYWRFKGVAFSCIDSGVEHRAVDASILAARTPFVPSTLGVRAQALKLRMVSPETAGRFLKVRYPLKKFLSSVMGRAACGARASEADGIHHQAFVGEAVSLIYSPLVLKDDVAYDGILNRPLGAVPEGCLDDPPAFEECRPGNLNFIAALCPYCGWDLEGERDARVLLCRNCDSAWESSHDGLVRLDYAVLASGSAEVSYFPFWRVRAKTEGLELESYADLVRLANLPRAVKAQWHDRELHFWLPAFKVPSKLTLRLARLVSIFQPSAEGFERNLPNASLYPVTLPLAQAARVLKVAVAALAVPKRVVFPRLPEVKMHIGEHLLVYIPFALNGSEFVQREMRLAMNRSALHYGRLL